MQDLITTLMKTLLNENFVMVMTGFRQQKLKDRWMKILNWELLTGVYTVRKTYYMYKIQSLENELGFKGVREIQLAEWLNFVLEMKTLNTEKNPLSVS